MVISLDEYVYQAACNNPIGLVHITVSGGTQPYSYQWSDGSTLEDRDGLVPGDYTVTVTDFIGATVSQMFSVYGNPTLIVGITQAELPTSPIDWDPSACSPARGQPSGTI